MNILLPQKRNLDLLVILFVVGAAGCASFLTQIAISSLRYDSIDVTDWGLAAAIIVMAAALVTITVYGYISFNDRVAHIITETVDALATGVVRFDHKGRIIHFNPAAAIILPELCFESYEGDFIGTYKKFLGFIFDHSLDVQDQSRIVNETRDIHSKLLFKEIIATQHNRTVMVHFYQRPNNEIIAVLNDISLLRRSADRTATLNEQNNLMIKAIEAGGNGVLISRIENGVPKIIYSNEIFRHATHLNTGEISNQNFYKVMDSRFPVQKEKVLAGFGEALETGKSEIIWLSLMEENRKEKWFSLSMLSFSDNGGQEFLVCFFSDQTQARLEEARLFQTQKMDAVAQLAGGIAHDFNNVLAVIDGYTKLMQLGLGRGEDINQHFDKIKSGVRRGTEITSRLLTFGMCRMTETARIDICEQVRDVELLIHPMLDKKTKLIFSVQDEACYVDISPDSVAQILLSLVSNSCDAMEAGGEIVISVSEADQAQLLSSRKKIVPSQKYICLQVMDNGEGIDEETQKKIFEPFFTTKDVALHPGLGLSLVYAMIRDLDGFIEIRSAKGLGTIVSILLPEKPAPERTSLRFSEVEPEYMSFKGKTILIVDDVIEVLEIEAELMEEAGFKVLKASNVHEALQIAKDYKGGIDNFLIDVTLPEMSGIELEKKLLAIWPNAKSVLISGYPSPLHSSQGEEEFDAHTVILSKPLKFADFKKCLLGDFEEDRWVHKNNQDKEIVHAE